MNWTKQELEEYYKRQGKPQSGVLLVTTNKIKIKFSESDEQIALFEWADMSGIPELELMYHIPNGGKRYKATAGRLKKEGVKPGIPDIFLPVPNKKYHGLYIEMKARHNSETSDYQKIWIDRLYKQGYDVHVCYGWEAARDTILWYLDKIKG
jgi:hypothetical protein